MDFLGMMSKAKEMQARMSALQEELVDLQVTGASGAGMVSVTLNGKGSLVALKIDPSLLKPEEVEILEDLIVAAHRDAQGKQEAAVAAKMQELTAGLGLPPGMKLPF